MLCPIDAIFWGGRKFSTEILLFSLHALSSSPSERYLRITTSLTVVACRLGMFAAVLKKKVFAREPIGEDSNAGSNQVC